MVLPSWYQLTQVVVEKRRLNGCRNSSSSSSSNRVATANTHKTRAKIFGKKKMDNQTTEQNGMTLPVRVNHRMVRSVAEG